MADFHAIAQAVAARFSAANITPPSGATDIRLATEALPQAISVEPTVLVFPPEVEFTPTNGGVRAGWLVFPVRFYLQNVRDHGRNTTLALKWHTSLYDQLTGQVHLGLSSYVTHCEIRNITTGELEYGGQKYMGVELEAHVHIWEALSAVA